MKQPRAVLIAKIPVIAVVMTLALFSIPGRGAMAADPQLYAAASTAPALRQLAARYHKTFGDRLVLVVAASSALARQIEAGAPADVFLSANVAWMDYLASRGRIIPKSRRDLLANRLVLAAPQDSDAAASLTAIDTLVDVLGNSKLALCETRGAPCGIYAREALQTLGLWSALEPHIVYGADARATANWVARGEVDFGVLYRTDAAGDTKIAIIDELPETAHQPIRYPVAAIAGGDYAAATRLLAFLQSAVARRIFAAHGFHVLP